MRKVSVLLLITMIFSLILPNTITFAGKDKSKSEYASEAVVLMEGSTGKVLYSKNETKKLRPASITKIMTLLLIFEAIDNGRIALSDSVVVSEHAASMGGSQVYLEAGEQQTVDTMIKCISIASANDASVAMAEHIAGSEEEFVSLMNRRAEELKMANTNFVNCYGLDTDNHYISALDVAIMSRELIVNHPEISNYSCTWMDTFTHTTRRGEESFGLTNTNKLIKSYNGITGLKTGSTGLAKYCLSATARRNDMNLIAVIMAAPTTKERFSEAATLLNYGFANYKIYTDKSEINLPEIPVNNGKEDILPLVTSDKFSYLADSVVNTDLIEKEIVCPEQCDAPIDEGTAIGKIIYKLDGKEIGSIDILAAASVEKATLVDCFGDVFKTFLGH